MSAATHTQHEKALFLRGVRLTEELNGEFIVENRLCLLERHAMLSEVRGSFGWIPVKLNHLDIVWMLGAVSRPKVLPFVGLRASYGPQELLLPNGHRMGVDLLQYNLLRSTTWSELLVCLGVVPLAALYSYRHWPLPLRVSLWTIVPLCWWCIAWRRC